MNHYILIVLLTGSYPAASMQEFTTKEKCEAAAEKVKDSFGAYRSPDIYCVEK
jgi:hypothetical protein